MEFNYRVSGTGPDFLEIWKSGAAGRSKKNIVIPRFNRGIQREPGESKKRIKKMGPDCFGLSDSSAARKI